MIRADPVVGGRDRAAAAALASPAGRLVSFAVVAVALAAYVVGPILDQRIPEVFRHIDWVSYSRAAERFVAGQPLYAPAQLAGPYRLAEIAGIGYVYPPPSVLLFVPFLALGPTAWAVANAALFASGIAAMLRRDFGRVAPLAFGVALLPIALTTPYLDAMVMGSSTLGVAGLFAWAWAAGPGSRPIGWLAAFGGLIKLFPLALVGWTRPAELVRTGAVAVAVVAAVAVATLPIVGIGSWLDFGTAMANARPLCGTGLDAVACRLVPTLGVLATPILVVVAAGLVATAVVVRERAIAFTLIVLAVLISLPEVFGYSLLFVEVLAVAVACDLARRRGWAVGDPAS